MNNFKDLLNNLSLLKKLYDLVRIVDPIGKKIVYYNGEKEEFSVLEDSCYKFWKNSQYCNNCISARSYNENDTFVKIEYNKERIFMVIAAPLVLEDNKFILEMLKDVTDTCIIENFNNQSADEIQKIINEMNDVSIKDELTGAYNRRLINEKLPVDILKCATLKQPLSIVMADIDLFKAVNDNYGHLGGDYILSQFTLLIKKSIREEMDWVGRYGGDEFLIVLDNAENDIAYEIIEKIRRKIEKKTFHFDNHEIKITASFGIYTFNNFNSDINIEDLLKHADEKLYEAKNNGKNNTAR
jgi:diguanylate cyclase (GGDEF)-like protein